VDDAQRICGALAVVRASNRNSDEVFVWLSPGACGSTSCAGACGNSCCPASHYDENGRHE
jgi:hypothetical protein